MNTEITIHGRLRRFGLITANLDAMIEWSRKVLGMAGNHCANAPGGPDGGRPFSAFAFISNDEIDHRIVFEVSGAGMDAERGRHTGLQHVSRLNSLPWTSFWAPMHGRSGWASCRYGPPTMA